jgi:hypothetical protein
VSSPPSTVAPWLHLYATADESVVMRLARAVGTGYDTLVVDGHDLVHWAIPDQDARAIGILRRAEYASIDEASRPVPHWPRVAFAQGPAIDPPAGLLEAGSSELVHGPTCGMWLHLVDATGACMRSLLLDDAIDEGVWGIEEACLAAGDPLRGWYVTVDQDPGSVPADLYTFF